VPRALCREVGHPENEKLRNWGRLCPLLRNLAPGRSQK
jgi:hypothetical protein